MFDSERPQVYEEVYAGLVARLATADLKAPAMGLGLAQQDGAARVPLLGRDYLVDRAGVRAADGAPAAFTHRIVLAYYLLHGGRGEPAGRFVPYRELPGGADFARNMAITVEGRLAGAFSGRLGQLEAACQALGGARTATEARVDLAIAFTALPGLPLMVTFNDADEDFPAEAKLFYDLTAPNFLDLECLAVLGLILVLELEAAGA
ncbi:MAG: DUF3786 domain-containing protein [Desulfarculus sp.]|nr:DUF3786 domain-containing protein [Desulfarculus sp.]